MPATALIELRGVIKTFITGHVPSQILKGISLTILSGEHVALTGSSGSGKSTLLNILGCLDVPTQGSYLLEGRVIDAYTEDELARVRNRIFGFVFQSFNLLGRYSVAENISLPLVYAGVNKRERLQRTQTLLEQVGLAGYGDHYPAQLSGGMQQRVAIARALVHQPKVIFADEPTGNLDSKTGQEIIELFNVLHRAGTTLVIVTHDARVAAHAGRVLRMVDGLIIEDLQHSPARSIAQETPS